MTFPELFARANLYQRERLLDLVTELRALRREIEDHDIADVEPRLASPRSALNPRHFSETEQ
jgi:hypothetical protein